MYFATVDERADEELRRSGVHAYHDKWGRLAGAIGARIALPALGGYANNIKNQELDARGLAWGVIGGMAAATIPDAVLSRD